MAKFTRPRIHWEKSGVEVCYFCLTELPEHVCPRCRAHVCDLHWKKRPKMCSQCHLGHYPDQYTKERLLKNLDTLVAVTAKTWAEQTPNWQTIQRKERITDVRLMGEAIRHYILSSEKCSQEEAQKPPEEERSGGRILRSPKN